MVAVRGPQRFTTNPPEFVGQARVQFIPLSKLSVTNMFTAGHGRSEVKLFSRLRVVEAKGPEVVKESRFSISGSSHGFNRLGCRLIPTGRVSMRARLEQRSSWLAPRCRLFSISMRIPSCLA